MALLNESIQGQVRQMLQAMDQPVRLVVFTQGEGGALECGMCAETRQLVEEVAALNDKIKVEVLDFVADASQAERYQVDKIPAIVFLEDGPTPKDTGMRMYGIPSGYEFSSLLEDLLLVSRRKADLSPKTQKELSKIQKPVHIQVFVTPT